MFITFEGIDFCGKSTQVRLLKEYLLSKGEKVLTIREPGGTILSERIREMLLNKKNSEMSIETEIFLFSASRAQLVRSKIHPCLLDKYFVISDRFHDSTTAYQGFGRGISLEAVEQINKLAIGDTIPDITFFIDISIAEAERRKSRRSVDKLDRIEVANADFFTRVRDGYFEIARKESRFRIVDGVKTIQEIHNFIVAEINNHRCFAANVSGGRKVEISK